jgi:hypothetical protein
VDDSCCVEDGWGVEEGWGVDEGLDEGSGADDADAGARITSEAGAGESARVARGADNRVRGAEPVYFWNPRLEARTSPCRRAGCKSSREKWEEDRGLEMKAG